MAPESRSEHLSRAGQGPFDLIVIGAGINGAGIARDAAMRGLRTLLLDKGDIGGGTTSGSTRLIHGGLRYLEHGEIGLVRESLREREVLLRIAPHLVRPLDFLIPIYAGSRRGPGLIRLGMLTYDLLSFDKSLPRHRMLTARETLRREPGLAPEGLRGGACYRDAQVAFPERLALENALAAQAYGAVLLTYARVDRLLRSAGRVEGVTFTDLVDGGQHTARASLTINASGPWVDDLLGDAGARPLIGGTKGTHIVVGPFPGAPRSGLYVEAGQDQRPYFILPWNGQFLIGTTDLPYAGDLDNVNPSEEEIRYLLDETNRVIPGAGLTRGEVRYAYAGVRPLPATNDASAAAITRRHIIHDHAPDLEGLLSVVGGKLTTYRSLAEEAVDLVFRKLGRVSPRCTTAGVPLPGAIGVDFDGFAIAFRDNGGLAPAVAERLVPLYGIRAWDVIALGRQSPELLQPFDPVTGALAAEIIFALEREHARTLEDLLLRRTMVGLGPDAGLHAADGAAQIAVTYAGWTSERAAREVEQYRAAVASRLSASHEPPALS
jgi:glycerol-3-phosphate dehydrogenase